jgi:hypothetical protein
VVHVRWTTKLKLPEPSKNGLIASCTPATNKAVSYFFANDIFFANDNENLHDNDVCHFLFYENDNESDKIDTNFVDFTFPSFHVTKYRRTAFNHSADDFENCFSICKRQ